MIFQNFTMTLRKVTRLYRVLFYFEIYVNELIVENLRWIMMGDGWYGDSIWRECNLAERELNIAISTAFL